MPTFNDPYATFTQEDVGRYIYFKRYRWYHLAWDWIRTRLFKKETNLQHRYMITGIFRCTEAIVEPTFFCPGCKKIRPYSHGCDDAMPELCDDCWAIRQEEKGTT